jgi:hypothetical protein
LRILRHLLPRVRVNIRILHPSHMGPRK